MSYLKFDSEEELGKAFSEYLTKSGETVYSECVFKFFGGRPDIISVKGIRTHLFELKLNFGLPVVDQVYKWFTKHRRVKSGYPNKISIVVPFKPKTRRSDLLMDTLKQYGIGLYEVRKKEQYKYGTYKFHGDVENNDFVYSIDEVIKPKHQKLGRIHGKKLLGQLYDDMKDANAGTTGVGIMTPFKRTMKRISDIMDDGVPRKPMEIVEILEKGEGHHYSNKYGCSSAIRELPHLAGLERHEEYGYFIKSKKKGAS